STAAWQPSPSSLPIIHRISIPYCITVASPLLHRYPRHPSIGYGLSHSLPAPDLSTRTAGDSGRRPAFPARSGGRFTARNHGDHLLFFIAETRRANSNSGRFTAPPSR